MDKPRRPIATYTLVTAWVGLFVAMLLWQGQLAYSWNPFRMATVGIATSHVFGDVSAADLYSWQLWRTITATFVHYGLLHLALNLIGLWQLGSLVEDWYGPGPFLGVYVFVSAVGNLAASLTRPYFGASIHAHSAGGSTVAFGLVGLCAVVAWRQRRESKVERELFYVMLAVLALNVIISAVFSALRSRLGMNVPSLDNFAHTFGTLAGGAVGLFHQSLLRMRDRPAGRRMGWLASAVLTGCALAQVWTDRVEHQHTKALMHAQNRLHAAASTLADLVQLDILYRLAFYRGLYPQDGPNPRVVVLRSTRGNRVVRLPAQDQIARDLQAVLLRLESSAKSLGEGPSAHAYARLRAMAARAEKEPPKALFVQEFETYLATLLNRAEQEQQAARSRVLELNRTVAPR